MTKNSQAAFLSLILLSTSVGAIALALNARTTSLLNDHVDFTGKRHFDTQAHGNYKNKVGTGKAKRETDFLENAESILNDSQANVSDLVKKALVEKLSNSSEFNPESRKVITSNTNALDLTSEGSVSIQVNIGGKDVTIPVTYTIENNRMHIKLNSEDKDEIDLDL